MLADVADVVHSGVLARVRDELSDAYPLDPDRSRERIAGFLEEGVSLLTSNRYDLQCEPGLSMERIERCRLLAETDRRFRFIYRLPSSVGWGTAIGETLEGCLYGESRDGVRAATGLMNAFMTLLDGMLDEAPEVIAPHREALMALVSEGSAGRDITGLALPDDHPCNYACFLVCRLWIHGVNALPPQAQYRADFADAARRAMLDEYATCDIRFAAKEMPTVASLYGRTCWPLWTQALVCACRNSWPADLDYAAYRNLIFSIGDLAAYLDDLRDYVGDCRSGQWNTISLAYFSRRAYSRFPDSEIAERLLTALAESEFASEVVQTGHSLRQRVEDSILASGIEPAPLRELVSDLTFDYLH